MKFFRFLSFCVPLSITALTFHPEEKIVSTTFPFAGCSTGYINNDEKLVERIVAAYQYPEKHHLGYSMWQTIYDQKFQSIHQIFQSGNLELATDILRNPHKTDLFYGIDNLCISILPQQMTQEGLIGSAKDVLDCLVRFGEAIGAVRLYNREGLGPGSFHAWTADQIIQTLENYLRIPILFPNPYAYEIGICTVNGNASYRAVQALYQAYRIKELVQDIPSPRVLEIGAGLGRTAYYCQFFGITDYTIIDIPMTALSSSYFLGRTLGEDKIALVGESLENSKNKVKIFTPDEFLKDTMQYDLIVNFDSLTEIDSANIAAYLRKIQELSPLFLSVNHEVNLHSVFEVLSSSAHLKKVHRYPYWMRMGYVEELYQFK